MDFASLTTDEFVSLDADQWVNLPLNREVEVEPETPLVVSLESVKLHCKVDSEAEDDLITEMILAATDYAEDAMGCTLLARDRTEILNAGGTGLLPLPRGPILSITGITDDLGRKITSYRVVRTGLMDWVQVQGSYTLPLRVDYRAGYETAQDVPPAIRQAIRMHAATLYAHRESLSEVSLQPVPQSLADFYRLKRRHPGIG